MATCKTCGATPETAEFYGSIGTYCKEHWRERVAANRAARSDYYQAKDRERANLPHRVEARRRYATTERGREAHARASARYVEKHPERYTARNMVNAAIRDGRLQPWPVCALPTCEEKPEAHHPDYSRPLDVVWLCHAHHKQAHALFTRLVAA